MTEDLLRVVVVRKGKVKSTEFLLREGEIGLSMFWKADSPGVDTIIEAVRAAGKQGELGVVEISVSVFERLGLRLISTLGGTPDPAVNALHVEARPTWWQRIVFWVRRRPVYDWFNERIAPQLAREARLIEGDLP